QRPAGQEAGQVVERPADEGRRAAGLRDRSRALRVRERDNQEESADQRQHLGREPERVQRDDPERDVDRRGDLAVRHREERGRVEHPLETRDLARHAVRLLPAPEQVEPTGAEGEEEQSEQVADPASMDCGLDEQRNSEADRDDAEERDGRLVELLHAARRAAATSTRQGAFLRTYATVPPKIFPSHRGASRRGEPSTIISLWRLAASATIAGPGRRAR